MFKIKRNYGNGFEVEVQDPLMTKCIEKLSVADELFMDVRCAANIDGEVVVSDKVRFQHRKHDDNDYYEQVCMDGKLKWFKRKLGQHKGSTIGSLFVNTKTNDEANTTPGYAGWGKYNGSGGQQQGGYASNAPQREAAPPPPPPRPAPASVSYDDIPF